MDEKTRRALSILELSIILDKLPIYGSGYSGKSTSTVARELERSFSKTLLTLKKLEKKEKVQSELAGRDYIWFRK